MRPLRALWLVLALVSFAWVLAPPVQAFNATA